MLPVERHDQKVDAVDLRKTAFVIELRVPVMFGFVANIEQGCVDLSIRNFDNLGLRKLSIKPGDITDKYMDRIGRYLLREQEDFFKLDISDGAREQIRNRLRNEREQLERELHEQEMNAQAEEAEKKSAGPSLLTSLRQLARNK